ncbi:hypothetical protein [Streptomyces albipurpureus]|uniref:Uncharacterized protein n=1 Tax=Streptomyces albipurpureus TaxID=2897419 RepID=A0ABT0UIV2_9ACTN|nr:hypothetical protein [Streptomyces sp. CWNU-1]MCM2388261.1 hypothetical protein [Streptomyces sp. CWNU-1]
MEIDLGYTALGYIDGAERLVSEHRVPPQVSTSGLPFVREHGSERLCQVSLARVGIGFEDNPVATIVLGILVMMVSFALLYWRYKREGK